MCAVLCPILQVSGLDLRTAKKDSKVIEVLEKIMAQRGYLAFRGQGVLSGDEQVKASELFGGKQIHSTHGVHPKAPNKHIFRLANDREHGILGVGPQWHNDGSFERAVFSHVGYHIIRVPEHGGATRFAHQGAAFDALTPEEQEVWSRRVSINSNSGILHPMVHYHPISGRKSIYLHLGMTGGVLEMKPGVDKVEKMEDLRLLEQQEMTDLFNRYNDILNNPAYSRDHEYAQGDCVIIDNLAIAVEGLGSRVQGFGLGIVCACAYHIELIRIQRLAKPETHTDDWTLNPTPYTLHTAPSSSAASSDDRGTHRR
jgi:taurine dioxygenase